MTQDHTSDFEAAVLFKQAVEFAAESPARAIELLNCVLVLCRMCNRESSHRTTEVAARIELFKLHQGLGQSAEALEHFTRAIELGANASRLLQ